jgi:hypothetical protein
MVSPGLKSESRETWQVLFSGASYGIVICALSRPAPNTVSGHQHAGRHGDRCGSHPAVDRIVAAAASINPRIHAIAGEFHLVVTSDAEIEKIAATLHDTYKVEYVGPGHSTGEPALNALKKEEISSTPVVPSQVKTRHCRRTVVLFSYLFLLWSSSGLTKLNCRGELPWTCTTVSPHAIA